MQKVEFSYWLPENLSIDNIKYAIILSDGVNSNNLNSVNESIWQDFALKINAILIGAFFIGTKKVKQSGEEYDSADYCYVISSGSGQTLINYLESLGVNLYKTKLLLWGMSAGGQFNFNFANSFANITKAFVVNKGGQYYTNKVNKKISYIPALFFIGQNDEQFRKDTVTNLYDSYNIGNWKLIKENCAHDIGESIEKSIDFFEKIAMI